jgi:predicted O-methyltransferase YrrM
MASDLQTGSLLSTLAASKAAGRFLELGTGTGLSTACILSGMDASSQLDTVDSETRWIAVAREFLGHDRRVTFHVADGAAFLSDPGRLPYDFIFADTWPGKFTHLDEALALLKPGGLYIIDDLLPQPNWPEGHAPKVPVLIEKLHARNDLTVTKLCWSTGLMIVAKRSAERAL